MKARRLTQLLAVAIIGGGAMMVTGCSELLGKDSDDNSSQRSDTLSRGRVPGGATILDQGKGPLKATARESGTVYLYDADDQRVVWSGNISRGQEFAVDPDADRAVIDSEPVYRQNLERNHTHRIYFSSR